MTDFSSSWRMTNRRLFWTFICLKKSATGLDCLTLPKKVILRKVLLVLLWCSMFLQIVYIFTKWSFAMPMMEILHLKEPTGGLPVIWLPATPTGPEARETRTRMSRMEEQRRTASTRASPTPAAGQTTAARPRRRTPCPASHCASTARCISPHLRQLQVTTIFATIFALS